MDANKIRKMVKAWRSVEWHLQNILREIGEMACCGEKTMFCEQLADAYNKDCSEDWSPPPTGSDYHYMITRLEALGFTVGRPQPPCYMPANGAHCISWREEKSNGEDN